MEPREIGDVLLVYKKRIEQMMSCESIKYVKALKNHVASAGASMSHSHSHSQIMPILIIPPSVSACLDAAKEYFDKTGKCSLCTVHMNKLIIDDSTHFISVVPFATTFTF